MAHRELLTESQRLSFHAPASDERGMVRHYTWSADDLALINRRRGDPNRLGFAVMLCYLRFPGRILQQGEQPPAELCTFVAEQLGLDSAQYGDYAERDQTRREHVLEIQAALGLSPTDRCDVPPGGGLAVANGARDRPWADAGGFLPRIV
jgi:TnpA family transposase